MTNDFYNNKSYILLRKIHPLLLYHGYLLLFLVLPVTSKEEHFSFFFINQSILYLAKFIIIIINIYDIK